MRKIAIGFITAILLLTATVVGASGFSSMVGKKVTSEASVFVNGEAVSDAVIIEGKSYAPVRDIVEALESNVTYSAAKEKGGKASVNIDKPLSELDSTSLEYAKAAIEAKITEIGNRLTEYNAALSTTIEEIARVNARWEDHLARNDDESLVSEINENYENILNKRNAEKEFAETKIAELEAERDELQNQLESTK